MRHDFFRPDRAYEANGRHGSRQKTAFGACGDRLPSNHETKRTAHPCRLRPGTRACRRRVGQRGTCRRLRRGPRGGNGRRQPGLCGLHIRRRGEIGLLGLVSGKCRDNCRRVAIARGSCWPPCRRNDFGRTRRPGSTARDRATETAVSLLTDIRTSARAGSIRRAMRFPEPPAKLPLPAHQPFKGKRI